MTILRAIIYSFVLCMVFSQGILFSISPSEKGGYCIYVAPEKFNMPDLFFDFARLGHNENETFESLRVRFQSLWPHSHRFHFKYPLKDKEQALIFSKILHIKAQQAHRFVSLIANCQFIAPSHLGFMRTITVKEKDYLLQEKDVHIQEHVLVDAQTHAVMFIEDWITLSMDEVMAGHFAALNEVVEEEGQWYFAGTYLYDFVSDVEQSKQMFDQTYESMLLFQENEDVEAIYQQLSDY